MDAVHVIVKNAITVENGEISIIREIIPSFGFYYGDDGLTHCIFKCNTLNKIWGCDKEASHGITGIQYEEEFYSNFGCEPYEYITLKQRTV